MAEEVQLAKEQAVSERMQPSQGFSTKDGEKRREQVRHARAHQLEHKLDRRGRHPHADSGSWEDCCRPRRDTTKCTHFTTAAGPSTRRSCFVASFGDKRPRVAEDCIFFLPLSPSALLLCKQRLCSYQPIVMP